MSMSVSARRLAGLLATAGLAACAGSPLGESYGRTDFAATGSRAAHAVFVRGLLQLHNFEYEDARSSFRKTREIDPDFTMAWWGEALSWWHPLWRSTDLDAARAVLARMGPSPEARIAMGRTERERDYLATIEILFADGDLPTRRGGYSDALKALHEKYPDDLDAAAFYALSILARSNGRKVHHYMQAGAITEEILDANPLHPGGLHYNIHSYDDTIHAPLGLRAARDYYKVAPSAVHALHMGAHIYYATGKWQLGIERNVDSFEKALERMEDPYGPYHPEAFHSLSWIPYGFQQLGDPASAREYIALIGRQVKLHGHAPPHGPMGRMHYVEARASYVIDTEDWECDLLEVDVDLTDLPPYFVATEQYVRGVVALKTGKRRTAKRWLRKMGRPRLPESGRRTEMGPALLKLALEGRIAIAEGRVKSGLAKLHRATEIDLDWPAEAGPVKPVQPMAELLAWTYLDLGRRAEAKEYFEIAQLYSVGRARTLQGLAELAND